MGKFENFIIKGIIFILNLAIFLSLLYFFLNKRLLFEVFLALVFLQFFICFLLLARYYIFKRFHKLARDLGFRYMAGFLEQPRMEGHYKDNWWQLHFVDKEYGESPSILRTYVKLQFK